MKSFSAVAIGLLATSALAAGPGHQQSADGIEMKESNNGSTINWIQTKVVDFEAGLDASAGGSDYTKVGADGKRRDEAPGKKTAMAANPDVRVWNAKGDEQAKSEKEQPATPTRDLKVGGAYTDPDGATKSELREFKVDANNNVWTQDGLKVLNAQGNQAKITDVENVIRNDQGSLKFGGTTFSKPKTAVGG